MIVVLAVLFEKTKTESHKDVCTGGQQGMDSINCKEKMWKRQKGQRTCSSWNTWNRGHPFSSKSLYSTPKFLRIFLLHYHLNSTLPELIYQNALGFNSYRLIFAARPAFIGSIITAWDKPFLRTLKPLQILMKPSQLSFISLPYLIHEVSYCDSLLWT